MSAARSKYAWIEKMKTEHSIHLMCRILKVSRSGFYEWRISPALIKDERMDLKEQILGAFKVSRKTYGHSSIPVGLIKACVPIGRRLTQTLMNEMAVVPGAYKRSPNAIIKVRANQEYLSICWNVTFYSRTRTRIRRVTKEG
jgi:hypothetical protein